VAWSPAGAARELLDDRVFFVRETDTIERAQLMLRNNGLEELLVVADGADRRVVGILTMADILLAYQRVMAGPRVTCLMAPDSATSTPPGMPGPPTSSTGEGPLS